MSPPDLDFLCALVRARSGLVIRGERSFFVETRLAPLARRERMESVSELVARVREKPADPLARATVEAMMIQETSFYRDRAAFGALESHVLPAIGPGKPTRRVWSAGCGKGQEAYSLAMLALEGDPGLPPVEILATDISTAVLEKAQTGVYSHFEVQRGLPIRRLLAHFEEVDESWRVKPEVRRRVRWMRLNLMDDFRVQEGYDLILCRNVVSAFAPDARDSVLRRLSDALAPGGRLMLGAGEQPLEGFVGIPAAPCVFGRQDEVGIAEAAA